VAHNMLNKKNKKPVLSNKRMCMNDKVIDKERKDLCFKPKNIFALKSYKEQCKENINNKQPMTIQEMLEDRKRLKTPYKKVVSTNKTTTRINEVPDNLSLQNKLIDNILNTEVSSNRQSYYKQPKNIKVWRDNSRSEIKQKLVGCDVVSRNELWLKRRNEKLAKLVNEKKSNELIECSFTPHFATHGSSFMHKKRFSKCHSAYSSLSPNKMSREELAIIKHSNSYWQIHKLKRARSRDTIKSTYIRKY